MSVEKVPPNLVSDLSVRMLIIVSRASTNRESFVAEDGFVVGVPGTVEVVSVN